MENLNIKTYKTSINEVNNITNYFLINNIDSKQSLTLANSLRRILLSTTYGISIQKFRIEGVKNEYTNIPGVREDIFDIILNLKQIIINSKTSLDKKSSFAKLVINKAGIITANSIEFNENITIINPNQYIMTVTNPNDLIFEFILDVTNSFNIEDVEKNDWFELNVKCNPILNVNFEIYPINTSNIQNLDCIKFEIITNGSITPKKFIKKAILNLYKMLNFLTLYQI